MNKEEKNEALYRMSTEEFQEYWYSLSDRCSHGYLKSMIMVMVRLQQKHEEYGETFRALTEGEIVELLKENFRKWKENEFENEADRLKKLADVAVCAILNMEWFVEQFNIELGWKGTKDE